MKPVLSTDYDPLHDGERLWALLTIADFASADGEYYVQVIGRLQTAARRAYFTGLDNAGAHDIAVDAFERARRAATDGKLRRDGNVAGQPSHRHRHRPRAAQVPSRSSVSSGKSGEH